MVGQNKNLGEVRWNEADRRKETKRVFEKVGARGWSKKTEKSGEVLSLNPPNGFILRA